MTAPRPRQQNVHQSCSLKTRFVGFLNCLILIHLFTQLLYICIYVCAYFCVCLNVGSLSVFGVQRGYFIEKLRPFFLKQKQVDGNKTQALRFQPTRGCLALQLIQFSWFTDIPMTFGVLSPKRLCVLKRIIYARKHIEGNEIHTFSPYYSFQPTRFSYFL